jgi:hypothetical protein
MIGMLRKSAAFVPRYYKFESIPLQRRGGRNSTARVRTVSLAGCLFGYPIPGLSRACRTMSDLHEGVTRQLFPITIP